MKLTFRTVTGESFQFEADEGMTIGALKTAVSAQRGLQEDKLKLVFKGKVLDKSESTILENGVSDAAFIVLFIEPARKIPAASAAPAATPAATPAAGTSGAAPAAAAATSSAPAAATPAPAAAASTPTPSSTAATPAAAAAGAPGGEASLSLASSTVLTGDSLQTAIDGMCEMGFERAEVVKAMRAAFNNPDRAIEYLTTGIPETAPPPAQQAAAIQPAQPAAGAGGGGQGAAAGAPALPFDMFGQLGAAARGGAAAAGGGGGGPLQFLQNNPQFQLLREAVAGDPQILVPMLQELGKSNPELVRLISSHQTEFLAMLSQQGDMGEEGGPEGMGAGGEGMPQMIELTQEEDAAVQRLQALGFDQASCIEAYFACDKNEELAANYLAEQMFDN